MTAARSTRIIDTLMAERAAGRLEYGGPSGGLYAATVRGRRRRYDVDRMTAWLDGYDEGRNTGRPADWPVMSLPLSDVWQLLVAPLSFDGRRLRVLTAMQVRGVGIAAAADLIGRRRESVRYALRFGRTLTRTAGHTPSLVALEEALEHELTALYGPAWRDIKPADDLLGAGQAAPEPVEFRRARCLLHAHRRGYLEWIAPTDPDHVRRAAWYRVRRHGAEFTMPARLVVPWLQGLADGASDDELAELLTDRRNTAHHVDDLPHVG